MWVSQKLVALSYDYFFRPERENTFMKIVGNTDFTYSSL